jgi:hypothetical protein
VTFTQGVNTGGLVLSAGVGIGSAQDKSGGGGGGEGGVGGGGDLGGEGGGGGTLTGGGGGGGGGDAGTHCPGVLTKVQYTFQLWTPKHHHRTGHSVLPPRHHRKCISNHCKEHSKGITYRQDADCSEDQYGRIEGRRIASWALCQLSDWGNGLEVEQRVSLCEDSGAGVEEGASAFQPSEAAQTGIVGDLDEAWCATDA